MNKLDVVGQVLQAMDTHVKQAKVIQNACMALAAMVQPDGQSYILLLIDSKYWGYMYNVGLYTFT